MDQVIAGGTNFLTVLLLGRQAGPDELGVFALVMTVYYLLLAVQEALITTPYTIYVARLTGARRQNYAGATLCQSAAWSACVALLLGLAAAVILFVSNDAGLATVAGAFAIVSPMWLLREFGRRYLFTHMLLVEVVVMSCVWSATQFLVLGVLAYFGRLSAATAIFALGVGSGIATLGWFWISRSAFKFDRLRWSHYALKHWLFGRWLLCSHSTAVISANVMPWLVLAWLGPAATGVYAACEAILRFANPIIVSLSNVLTPWAANGFNSGGKAALARIVRRTTILLSLFLLAFCLFLAITGDWILSHSFGADYSGYGATLVVLALNLLIAKLAFASSRALMVLERPQYLLRAEVGGLVTSLVAAVLLMPHYGVLGAACAMSLGSLVMSALTIGYYLVAMQENEREPLFPMGPVTASAASVGGASE